MKKILLYLALLPSYATAIHAMEEEATEVKVMHSICKELDEEKLKEYVKENIQNALRQGELSYKDKNGTWKLSNFKNYYEAWKHSFNVTQSLPDVISSLDLNLYPLISPKDDDCTHDACNKNSFLVAIGKDGLNLLTLIMDKAD